MGLTRWAVFCTAAAMTAASGAPLSPVAKPLALAKLADVPAEVLAVYRAEGDGGTGAGEKLDPDVNAFFRSQLEQGSTPEDAALALAIQFGLQQDEAADLALAFLVTFPSARESRFDPASLTAAKATYYRLLDKRGDLTYLLVPLGELLVQQHACGEAPFIERTLRKDAVFAVKIFHLTQCQDVLAQAAVKFPDDWRIAAELAALKDYGPAGDLAVRRETLVLMERANLPTSDEHHLLAWRDYLESLYRSDLSKQFAETVAGLDPVARDALLAPPPGGGAALIDEYVAVLLDLGRGEDAKSVATRYGGYGMACAASAPRCQGPLYRRLIDGGPVAGLLPAYRTEIAASGPLAQAVARRLKSEGRSDAAAGIFPAPRPSDPTALAAWAENETLLKGLEPDYGDWKQGFQAGLDQRRMELAQEAAEYRPKP